jgi:hypothetical protein
MRAEIRTALLSLVSNRVYEPYMVTKDTVKPYIVLKFGVEPPDSMKNSYKQYFQVWPYVKRESFTVLDTLVAQIIAVLHNKEIDSKPIIFEGKIGQDYFDPDWLALTQELEFSYSTIHE